MFSLKLKKLCQKKVERKTQVRGRPNCRDTPRWTEMCWDTAEICRDKEFHAEMCRDSFIFSCITIKISFLICWMGNCYPPVKHEFYFNNHYNIKELYVTAVQNNKKIFFWNLPTDPIQNGCQAAILKIFMTILNQVYSLI